MGTRFNKGTPDMKVTIRPNHTALQGLPGKNNLAIFEEGLGCCEAQPG